MAIKKFTVDLPDRKVSIRKTGNNCYVYLVTEYYQTPSGHYSNKAVCIGRLDEVNPTKMFPNDQYFEVVEPQTVLEGSHPSIEFIDAGQTVFLAERAEVLGISALLQRIFPGTYEAILSLAIYMVCRGNVMAYLDDFYVKNLNPYTSKVAQRHLGKIYESISKDKRWDFFKDWKKQMLLSEDYVAYDVTSISTYAREIPFAEKGYNRDHEFLPQINVGLFYAQQAELPVGYDIYSGSLTDQTHLPSMLDIAHELGIHPYVYVMDKGFLNQDNLELLSEQEVTFLMSFPDSQLLYRQALLQVAPSIRQMSNYIAGAAVYGIKTTVKRADQTYTLFCYLDQEKANVQEKSLAERLTKREETLTKQLNKTARKKKDPYFKVTLEKETILDFERDEVAIHEALQLTGMFGLITNQTDMTPSDALKIYRRRNMIETHYDSMKNQLDFDRLHTHSEQSTEGKFFIGFIAQILVADLNRHMNKLQKKPVGSIRGLLLELEKIQRVSFNRGAQLMAPLTKKQKDILNIFDIDQKSLREKIIKIQPEKSPSV